MNIYRKLYESQIFDQEWANEAIRWEGDLNLVNSQIQSSPKLESVGGNLNLLNSKVQSLPHLESVRGWLSLENSQIQSLPELKSVKESLNLSNSQIQSLPNLETVGLSIYVDEHKFNYWKLYFLKLGRKHLVKKLKILH